MRSSRRSSASSSRIPDPLPNYELLIVAADVFAAEQARLALGESGEWLVRLLEPGDEQPVHDALPTDLVALLPASRLDLIPTIPDSVPLVLFGSPTLLPALGPYRFDDFLTYPWSPDELRFRLQRLIGIRSAVGAGGTLRWGRFWISAGAASARVPLSPVHFLIIDMLARARGECVPREALEAVMGEAPGSQSRAVDMQVSRLRRRLTEACWEWSRTPTIESVRGSGYRIIL